jgi:hypothetical protein
MTKAPTLTADQKARKEEFDRLFARLQGSNVQRITTVCLALEVKSGTVRGWTLKNPHRVPSRRMLKLLQQFAPGR